MPTNDSDVLFALSIGFAILALGAVIIAADILVSTFLILWAMFCIAGIFMKHVE